MRQYGVRRREQVVDFLFARQYEARRHDRLELSRANALPGWWVQKEQEWVPNISPSRRPRPKTVWAVRHDPRGLFPRGRTVVQGSRNEALAYLREHWIPAAQAFVAQQ